MTEALHRQSPAEIMRTVGITAVDGPMARLPELVDESNRLAVQLNAIKQFMGYVEAGLPHGLMVCTWSKNKTALVGKGERPQRLYRPNDAGEYVPAGAIAIAGTSYPFLGDTLMETVEDGLIVINTERSVGLSADFSVRLIDTRNDFSGSSVGGSHDSRFRYALMPMIDQVGWGQSKDF